jgi:ABC-type glucose/galactose transport system permease subunit
MFAYGFSGMFSAFSGMLLLGYVTNPNLNLGINYGLPSVAAIVIGGIALKRWSRKLSWRSSRFHHPIHPYKYTGDIPAW